MANVGVVGLGYVGLPYALLMTESGHTVAGVDIDSNRVASLEDGSSYVNDINDAEVAEAVRRGFSPTTEYDALTDAEFVTVCVPTPMRKSGQPDISYVKDAVENIGTVISEGCTVILESTVYPGATEEVVVETLESEGFRVGEDVYVSFSPERVDPGNETYGLGDIPKVLGGVTEACGNRTEAFYSTAFEKIVRLDSVEEAELVKLLENTFRSVNIGLINEIAMLAHEMDVDIWNVVDAAETKPFGFMPFYPGPGLGGHCIPLDPLYLSWEAKNRGIETRFIDLADSINREMPRHVVRRVTFLLNRSGVTLSNADILIVGAAYKPDVSDTRESPALDIIHQLERHGATVSYHDPHVGHLSAGEKAFESISLTRQNLEDTDCAIVVTPHDAIDINSVVDHAPLVFDTRNATDGADASHVHTL